MSLENTNPFSSDTLHNYYMFLNQDWAARYWVTKGASKTKINIGVPLYGRTFSLPNGTSDTQIGCPATKAGEAGPFTREAGLLAYYEVCRNFTDGF